MKRSQDVSLIDDQDSYPRLNLTLTKSFELINLIETHLQEHTLCSPPLQKQTESSKASTPSREKLKAMSFPISMITIGHWTFVATNPTDIVAKFYFAKKKLLWEFLCHEEPNTNMPTLKRKIEMQWDDVSSFKESFNSLDETGVLKIELRKRPTFFIETNPQPGKHTQWKVLDHDFTDNQASLCRRHTLHFHPGVLQKNLEKLMSNSFWSNLYKVRFPLQEAVYFDIGYESNNNTSLYSPSKTIPFNVNNDLLHHHSQGIGHVEEGEGNFNMVTQFWANDGYSQNNTANELFGTQVITPVTNEYYNMQRNFIGSQYNNMMIQEESEEMENVREILGSQEYGLLETQNNLMMSPQMNDLPMYPQVGEYLAGTLLQEEERYTCDKYTHLNENFYMQDY